MGAINIAMHNPHSPERYVELFKEMMRLKKIVQVRGLHAIMLGSASALEQGKLENGITGEFYHFVQIDPNEPWFDIVEKDKASDEDLQKIKIPEQLKPHFAKFYFVFFPKAHRLFIQLKDGKNTISINTIRSALTKLLSDEELEKFGTIEVTVEPESESIEKIFAIPSIRTLKIELVRPNPDDHHEQELKFLSKLEGQGAGKMTVEFKASKGNSLAPDQETKILAKVASSNGAVYASGRNQNGIPVKLSTVDMPMIERIEFNQNTQTPLDALISAGKTALKWITNKNV